MRRKRSKFLNISQLTIFSKYHSFQDTLYVEQKQTYTLIVNEYDNVPSDERFQSKPLIKNQKRQNSLSVTEEVAQNQFKTDYSNITKSPRSPLTMDL